MAKSGAAATRLNYKQPNEKNSITKTKFKATKYEEQGSSYLQKFYANMPAKWKIII